MKRTLKAISCAGAAAVMMLSSGLALNVSAEWKNSSAGYYYTNENGKKLTGWHTIDGEKYYFGKDGIAATGFKKIDGKNYYFENTKKGRMATGWKKIGSDKYYFGSDGVMRTGWKTISKKKYYFGKDGKMAVGTVTVDGKKYNFGNDGALKGSSSSSATSVDSVKLGMSRKKVISSAKLKNYKNYDLDDGTVGIIAFPVTYRGADSSVVVYTFDQKDKLTGIVAINKAKSVSSTWSKSLKSEYKYNMTLDDYLDMLIEQLSAYGYSMTKKDLLDAINQSGTDIASMNLRLFYDDQMLSEGNVAFVAYYQGYSMCIISDVESMDSLGTSMDSFNNIISEVASDFSF